MRLTKETIEQMEGELDPVAIAEIVKMCADESYIPTGEDEVPYDQALRIGDKDVVDPRSFPAWGGKVRVPLVLLNGKSDDPDLSDPTYGLNHALAFE